MGLVRSKDSKTGGDNTTRNREQNNAKVARRRAHAAAERDKGGAVKPAHKNHLIPQRELDVEADDLVYIGQLIAGVEDFKILRSSVAVLSLTTSTEFAHLLADAAMISRGNTLVAVLYQVKRDYVFGDDGDDDAEQEG